MKPQDAYLRLKDGLCAVRDGVLGTVDHYIGRGVETIHENQPGTPVRVETRVPAAEYSGQTPMRTYSSPVGPYNGGLGSRVIRIGAERCNISRNALDKGAKRVRHTSWKARRRKVRKDL